VIRERLPMLSWQPPEATYLAWLDCADFVRFNFATSPDILDAATAQMATAR
jgi:cysteine-S-conjugate beta-lyase